MSNKRVHVFVEGRVQGVFFRETTKKQAVALGATGWVKNLPDGRVEAVIEGDEEAVSGVVKFVHKGPSNSIVSNVSVEDESFLGEFESFQVVI